MSKGMCGRCYDEVVDLFPANCAEKPEALLGQPIGQYHCPDCGAMVMAGMLHPELCQRCIERKHPEFDSRPAAPESETPESDEAGRVSVAILATGPTSVTTFTEACKIVLDKARSLERRLRLAQTEIKGHMRVEDELKADTERERMRVVGCSVAALGNWKEGDPLHADYDCVAIRDVAKLRMKYDETQARIAELEKDAARLDYLEREMELEQQYLRDHPQWIELGRPPSLFRRNVPITRAAIDAALKDRA